MKRLFLTCVLGSLIVVSTAQATTYVRVEKDGTKTYSDRPIPGGQPIDVQPAQTYSAPPSSPGDSRLPREQQMVQQFDQYKYEGCGITPASDATFANPESVMISANILPAVRYNDVATLTIDGQALAPNVTTYVMSPVYRGTHTVSVTIRNVNGQVLCTSSSSFHVQRPGLNSPARAPGAR
jgi:hypothetical protein